MQPIRDNARVLSAAMAGTAIEYYDFFIYATAAALFFGPQFFPAQAPETQVMLAFLTFSVAFVARPVGAVLFGHFGDRVGRKSTLVASLLLMGGSTLAIAFLPTYATAERWGAGWIAPLLLTLLRFGQGLGLGGEWAGAALLGVENAPPGWRARVGAAPQVGVPVGFIAANGVFLLLGLALDDAAMRDWGWRVPFLISALLVGLGLWVRLKLGETPAFKAALESEPPARVPLANLVASHLGALLAGSAGAIAAFAIFYLATAWALAEATGPLGYPREAVLAVQLVASLFLAGGIALSATLADRIGAARAIALGAAATVPVGLAFGPGLAAGSLAMVGVVLSAALFCLGLVNAPLGGWLSSLFPVRLRYTGVAFAFNFGGLIGGALTPMAAQAMTLGGLGRWTGLIMTGAGLLTWLGTRFAKPEKLSQSGT